MSVLKKALTTDLMPDLSHLYSWGLGLADVREWILVSGLGSTNPDWTIDCPGDPVGQTRANFERAESILSQAGASWRDVVRIDITVTEAARWSEHRDDIRAVIAQYFRNTEPEAHSRDAKDRLRACGTPRMLVEIEFLAAR